MKTRFALVVVVVSVIVVVVVSVIVVAVVVVIVVVVVVVVVVDGIFRIGSALVAFFQFFQTNERFFFLIQTRWRSQFFFRSSFLVRRTSGEKNPKKIFKIDLILEQHEARPLDFFVLCAFARKIFFHGHFETSLQHREHVLGALVAVLRWLPLEHEVPSSRQCSTQKTF